MRVLVTGCLGTLGRVLVNKLRSNGHDVYGCDLMHASDPKVFRADIAESRQVEAVFEKCEPEIAFHMAAEFGRNNGEDFPEQLWRTNCLGTRVMIDACVRHNARLVFASSSEAYGESSVYMQSDTLPLEESMLDKYAPSFHNEYAASKYINEKQIFIAAKNRGLKAVVLRLFNCYGPGERYTPYRSVVCLFIYRLMLGLPITVYKDYHRVFQWVGDWANTVAGVADRFDKLKSPRGVPVYNVGGAEYCSVEEMKDKIVALLGGTFSEITYVARESANVTNKRPDITLAKLDLGHDPSTLLDEGLPLTIDWMRQTYSRNMDLHLTEDHFHEAGA